MTTLHERVEQYLAIRRALGFKLEEHGRLLAQFVTYLDECGAAALTVEAALVWATRPQQVDRFRWRQRLSVVRGFARWLQPFEPASQVPPADLLAYRRPRPIPYLFTEADIIPTHHAMGSVQDNRGPRNEYAVQSSVQRRVEPEPRTETLYARSASSDRWERHVKSVGEFVVPAGARVPGASDRGDMNIPAEHDRGPRGPDLRVVWDPSGSFLRHGLDRHRCLRHLQSYTVVLTVLITCRIRSLLAPHEFWHGTASFGHAEFIGFAPPVLPPGPDDVEGHLAR